VKLSALALASTAVGGCNVAVIRNGAIACQRQSGDADVENGIKISPTSAFFIGSVSKQFTAMAVLLLQKDGKLNIDDDVRRSLPELPHVRQPLSLRNLLPATPA
jgi:CubicO group peptidase (beta-lactamase class C family)